MSEEHRKAAPTHHAYQVSTGFLHIDNDQIDPTLCSGDSAAVD